MKKSKRKLVSLMLVFTIVMALFIPTVVNANNNTAQKITFQLDNATVSENVITFSVGEKNITATVTGTGYTLNGNNLEVNLSNINNVKLALSDNFDSSRMNLQLHDGQVLIVTGDNEAIFDGLDFTNDDAPHLQKQKIL